jgi:hypothetical protein
VEYSQLLGFKARRIIFRHPTITALMLFAALAVYFYSYPRVFLPETCRRLDMADDGYRTTWIDRKCQKGSVVAFT